MGVATLVASGASALNTSTSPKTASVTLQAGDLLVVARVQESAVTSVNTTAPTGVTGATWTSRQSQPAAADTNAGRVSIHTAEGFSAGTYTLSCVRPGGSTSGQWGFFWAVFRGHGGVGATAGEALNTGSETPAVDITTTAADSCLFYAEADWDAIGGTQTGRTVGSATLTVVGSLSAANYSAWSGVWAGVGVGAAGTKTAGMSAPTGQRPSHAVIEILASGGTAGTFTTTVGNAPADGGSSTFTGDAVFSSTVGNAPADGGSSSFTGAAVFSTTVGNAPADGGSTSFTATGIFSTTAGDAPADGGSSTFTGAATFTTAAGEAPADGGVGSFTVGGSGNFVTIEGAATADGGSSTFTGDAVFATLEGNAPADGGSTSFTATGVFTTTAGSAAADGGSTSFVVAAPGTFATLAGNADAAGGTSSFTGDALFETVAGDALADGGTSSSTGGAVFVTVSGDATADGGSTSFFTAGTRANLPLPASGARVATDAAGTRVPLPAAGPRA